MTTAVEWALSNPAAAVSYALLTVGWLILAVPGLYYWIDLGILPMRKHWRRGWIRWPSRDFIEATVVTLGIALLWLVWLRIFIHML